ncbi:MAG: primosomal protein N' [Anaerolineales bacterium]|nr:primosomal protein N' [Anaerolineales bacterium]
MYAEVAVNVASLSGTFHYEVPPDLADRLGAGHLVTVPFSGREVQGIVVGLTDEPPEDVAADRLKTVISLVDPEPVLTRAQLDLAYWIAHTYLVSLIDALTLMLPPGLSKQAQVVYALAEPKFDVGDAAPAVAPNTLQSSIINLLKERGPLRARQLDRALAGKSWRSAAEALVRRGLVDKYSRLEPPSVHAKHVRTARLLATPTQLEAMRDTLSRAPAKGQAKAQRLQAALDFLAREGKPVEVTWVYAASNCTLQDLRELAERGLVALGEAEVWRDPLAGQEFVPDTAPPLTEDQAQVWEVIRQRMTRMERIEQIEQIGWTDLAPSVKSVQSVDNVFLLHGVTGSGKTEIYLRALDEVLRQGKRAIVLVPEISLTPQTVRRFAARFPGRVAVWHSQLGEGERYDTWRRARLGLVDIVIGARSALFAPLPDLGIIVLDEEHDEAYKQDPPQSVPYHAREAAIRYAQQLNAICLLGSATPDVVTYFRARRGDYRLLELPLRIMGHARKLQEQAEKYHVTPAYHALTAEAQTIDLPPVDIVDMRQELRMGNLTMFSRKLRAALTEVIARGEQAILFLNRRGTATFVFCRDCGEPLKCPNCDTTLTYHGAAQQLICHHCGHRQPQPERCPNCKSTRVKFFGLGTQKLAEAVQAEFPGAIVLRWDRDVTRTKGAHDLILHAFITQQANVLVGTQMIAKGLDLPLVTLVGVISADVGLGLPDYRAAERNFQLLTQVAGRAGRGLLGGRVILQTYQPEHYVIQAAARHDYAGFYQREIAYRKDLGLPPFRRVLRLLYRHTNPAKAEQEANVLAAQLRLRLKDLQLANTDLAGPAPAFFSKIANEYRWQIIVRGPDPAALLRGLPLKGWIVDVDPLSTL